MAILNRDDFFARLHERIGTDASDEATLFLEDMTDTYNDLVTRANGDGEDWRKKYEELDEAWKERYRHRFFSTDSTYVPKDKLDDSNEDDTEYSPEDITVESLFEEK